ncbi:hypothetical protein ACH5RR_037610 [Cinchona calisaya]|uniref:BTB domain-containing protein n=1 Tax=Cinchona calisaya TaxID=153742 RepID=A0ABD2Y836_9GENT
MEADVVEIQPQLDHRLLGCCEEQSFAYAVIDYKWVKIFIETSNKAVILKVHKEYVQACMEKPRMFRYGQENFVPLIEFSKLLEVGFGLDKEHKQL